MQVWQEVLKAALVGTDRQAPTFPNVGEPMGALLTQLNAEDKERTLLRACGLLTAYRRAGYRPALSENALPEPAEAEERPALRYDVLQDLLAMLSGEYRDALSEWLQAVAAKGWLVPEEHLAELLDFGRGHSEFRPDILPLLGRRGRWLAAQNPDWKYALQISLFEIEADGGVEAAGGSAETVWQTGTKEERVALLHRLRRSDPAQARAFVESTWKQDAPEERAAFLSTFLTGLSMEDEPFLEAALDDRRKEVRLLAQERLLRLPESRLCRRMWERVAPLVEFKPAMFLVGGISIKITLPEACDKAMLRDGIELKSPYSQVGEKAWWLQQMIARVPLAFWSREWERTPEQIVNVRATKEWTKALMEGWAASLARGAETAWAVALFQRWIEYDSANLPEASWVEILPADVLEAGIRRLLEVSGKGMQYGHPGFRLLQQHQKQWSAPLALTVLDYLEQSKGSRYYISEAMSEFVVCMPEELQGRLLEIWQSWAKIDSYLVGQLNRYLGLNAFRKEMRRKIAAVQEN